MAHMASSLEKPSFSREKPGFFAEIPGFSETLEKLGFLNVKIFVLVIRIVQESQVILMRNDLVFLQFSDQLRFSSENRKNNSES